MYVCIIARPEVMERAIAKLIEVFGEVGVKLNMAKIKVWCQDRSQVPASLAPYYVTDFKVLKRFLDQPGDLSHQGLPLPAAVEQMQPETQRQHQSLAKEIDRLHAVTAKLLELVPWALIFKLQLG